MHFKWGSYVGYRRLFEALRSAVFLTMIMAEFCQFLNFYYYDIHRPIRFVKIEIASSLKVDIRIFLRRSWVRLVVKIQAF